MSIVSWITGIALLTAFTVMLFHRKAMEEEVQTEEDSVPSTEEQALLEILNKMYPDSESHATAEISNQTVSVVTLLCSAVYISEHPDFLGSSSDFVGLLLANKDFCSWLKTRPDLLRMLTDEQQDFVLTK